MNTKLPAALAALLGAALTGNAQFTAIEVRDGESLEDAIARTHREECDDCRAEHEASLATAGGASNVGTEDVRQALYKKQQAERDELAMKQKAEIHQHEHSVLGGSEPKAKVAEDISVNRHAGMRPEMAMAYGTDSTKGAGEETAPVRKPIGYMAFHVTPDGECRAIAPSFNEDREKVEEAVRHVESHPLAMLLSSVSGTSVEVHPVYGE